MRHPLRTISTRLLAAAVALASVAPAGAFTPAPVAPLHCAVIRRSRHAVPRAAAAAIAVGALPTVSDSTMTIGRKRFDWHALQHVRFDWHALQHVRSFGNVEVRGHHAGRRRPASTGAVTTMSTTASASPLSDNIRFGLPSESQRGSPPSATSSCKAGPFPADLLLSRPKRFWVLVHAASSILFGGGVIVSTVVEWLVVRSKTPDAVGFWFQRVSNLDKALVLPALTGSIVSGFAQAAIDYGSMLTAPKHTRRATHVLATFTMWWGLTDLTTQQSARRSVSDWINEAREGRAVTAKRDVPAVLRARRWSNVVSCVFVFSLYALMADGAQAGVWRLVQ